MRWCKLALMLGLLAAVAGCNLSGWCHFESEAKGGADYKLSFDYPDYLQRQEGARQWAPGMLIFLGEPAATYKLLPSYVFAFWRPLRPKETLLQFAASHTGIPKQRWQPTTVSGQPALVASGIIVGGKETTVVSQPKESKNAYVVRFNDGSKARPKVKKDFVRMLASLKLEKP